jgi:hypothetical protein
VACTSEILTFCWADKDCKLKRNKINKENPLILENLNDDVITTMCLNKVACKAKTTAPYMQQKIDEKCMCKLLKLIWEFNIFFMTRTSSKMLL